MTRDNKNCIEIDNFKSTTGLTSSLGFESSLSVGSKIDDGPYVPAKHRELEHPNSVIGSVLHLLKACLGTGMLAMPSAFKNAGLVVGVVGTVLAGIICTYTMYILVRTSQELCVIAKKPSMSLAETCGAAFIYGPERVRTWGPSVKKFIDWSLALCYMSVLCVYIIFIGSSIKEVTDVYFEEAVPIQICCAVTLIPLVLMCQIRNLKYLVPFSTLANVCVLVIFVITLYYVFKDLPPISERVLVADIRSWPLFVSTVIFAFEGIGIIMPVENEMARPEKFLGCPGVLNVSMSVLMTLFMTLGFFGYVQFGDAVRGSVTLNLPQDEIIAQVTKLLMAFVIFLTFTIQFYVLMEVITRSLKENNCKYYNIKQVIIRTTIVCASVGVAAAFPNLELVIGLVGAIFFSTLGLFTPAVVDTVHRWDNLGFMNYVLFKNIILVLISIIALVSGSYVSILGIIEEFVGGSGENFRMEETNKTSYN